MLDATLPDDVPGGAEAADLRKASVFAWRVFIAMNWPANLGTDPSAPTREKADGAKRFGELGSQGLVVWETLRNKVEAYPGSGPPPGYVSAKQTGYDFPPTYHYSVDKVGGKTGAIEPCTTGDPQTPYVNLDEQSQIATNNIFVGGEDLPYPDRQILFSAKVNRVHYDYLSQHGWNFETSAGGQAPPFVATVQKLMETKEIPPPGSDDAVSFPNGSIEVKSAWRRLTAKERASGRFHSAPVRFYRDNRDRTENPQLDSDFCYVDEAVGAFGLTGIHFVLKTPSAPFYVWMTFEQVDAPVDARGRPIETPEGAYPAPGIQSVQSPYDPAIISTPAHLNEEGQVVSQALTLQGETCEEVGERMYFQNWPVRFNNPDIPSYLPQGTICVQRRAHLIPEAVQRVNGTFQRAIGEHLAAHKLQAPWAHYRLVNVQYKPVSKVKPGEEYSAANSTDPSVDVSTYYLSNIGVETNYHLSHFSGWYNKGDLISDFVASPVAGEDPQFHNVVYNKTGYNMGGCMGCHGWAQVYNGGDFTFLLLPKGGVANPEFAEGHFFPVEDNAGQAEQHRYHHPTNVVERGAHF